MLPSWHQHLKDVVRVGNLGYDVGPVPKRRWSQGLFFEQPFLARRLPLPTWLIPHTPSDQDGAPGNTTDQTDQIKQTTRLTMYRP